MAALWLVRHGQSAWNLAGRIQGQSARAGSLTPAGRGQAEQAAAELAAVAPGAVAVVASDLARAAETAAIIAGRLGLPLWFDAGLREQHLGALEGLRSTASDGGDVLDRLWDDPYRRPPGGESVASLYDRVQRTLRRLRQTQFNSELIVVTHGGPVRVATAACLPPPGSPLPRTAVANASITPWPRPVPAGRATGQVASPPAGRQTEIVAP
ncbi:MAG: histidine phosphatase family protein [Actinobacteria bacterium]|nr:histidine phosphatase family protein [Actinomycetota bacterium]